jgi:hypothetical protein
MWRDTVERYIREGLTVSGGCGASSAQVGLQNSQIAFYNQLTSQYGTIFGESQDILKGLTAAFEPILAKGPNQEGFSPAEKQALESQATSGVGANYAKAQAALATQQGAEGGGNSFLPAGAAEEQKAQLAGSAASLQSGEQLGIQQADYSQGLQNYQFASNELAGVASQLNPAGFANSATGAGGAASTTANEVSQANNSWMNLVSGGLGALGQATQGNIGCWIAIALWGEDSSKTHRVRYWIFHVWAKQSRVGRVVAWAYTKCGKRVARCPLLVKALRPLFELAWIKAQ